MKKSFLKRVLALVLCLALSAGYLPVPIFAEEAQEPVAFQQEEPVEEPEAAQETQAPTTEPTTEPTEESTAATEETAEAAEGSTEAPQEEPDLDRTVATLQALIDALPEEVTEDNAEIVAAQLETVFDGLEALTVAQLAQLDLTRYRSALAALDALTGGLQEAETLEEGETKVASITRDGETTAYTTLAAAMEAAQDNDTVTLLNDINNEWNITFSKTLTLDLDGHSLSDVKFSGSMKLTVQDRHSDSSETYSSNVTIDEKTAVEFNGCLVSNVTVDSNGQLCITGGTVKNITLYADSTLENNGGNVETVTLSRYAKISGGPFGQLCIEDTSEKLDYWYLRYFLEDGYLLYHEDGTPVMEADVQRSEERDEHWRYTFTISGPLTVKAHSTDHVYDRNTGECPCGKSYKDTRIGDNFYDDLETAFAAAEDGDTITILATVVGGEPTSDKTLTLDVNGQYMKEVYFQGSMHLTVIDSKTPKQSDKNFKACEGVTVTFASGEMEYVSLGGGTLVLAGGKTGKVICREGTSSLNIQSGSVDTVEVDRRGNMSITGGTVENVTMGNNSTLTANSCTVASVSINASCPGTLSGGPFNQVVLKGITDASAIDVVKMVPAGYVLLFSEDYRTVTAGDFKAGTEGYTLTGPVVGHTHSYDKNTGKCECGDSRIAQIDNTFYPTLQEAVNAAKSGNTVTLLVNSEETVTSDAGIALTLNLNGKTLAGLELTGSMSLTLTGGGKVRNVTLSGGTLTNTGSTVDSVTLGAGAKLGEGIFNQVVIGSSQTLSIDDIRTAYVAQSSYLYKGDRLVQWADIRTDNTSDGGYCYTVTGPVESKAHTHSYDGTTHECGCGEYDKAYVAKIEDTYYSSLSGAINVRESNVAITLLQDVDGSTVSLNSHGRTRTLDLNGRHIEGKLVCDKVIYLTVTDSTGGGTIDSIEFSGTQNTKNNQVTLESGEIKNVLFSMYPFSWKMTGGTVGTLTVEGTSTKSGDRTIEVSGGTVKNLTVNSGNYTVKITVSGEGTVGTAEIINTVKLYGGPYGKVRFSDESDLSSFKLSTYLGTGYGFAAADGAVREVELEDAYCVVNGPVTVADVYHNFDANGLCGNCGNYAAAKVDSILYMTLVDAMTAIGTEQKTIVLQRDVTETFQVPQGASPTLDLNGTTIASIQSVGSLTVTDSGSGGAVTSLRLTAGTATITGGTVANAAAAAGTLENKGGAVSAVTLTSADAKLSGGPFGQVSIESNQALDLDTFQTFVPSGNWFYDANGTPVSAAAVLAAGTENSGRYTYTVQGPVSVAAHTHSYNTSTGDCACGDYKVAMFTSNYDYADSFYDDLQSALNAASNGEAVVLMKDVEGDYTLRNSCQLYLGGHTIQGTLSISEGESTVNGSNVNSTISAIRVSGSETKLELDGQIKVNSLSMERGCAKAYYQCEIQNATLQNDATLWCNFSTVHNLTLRMTQNSHPKLLEGDRGTYSNVRILSTDPLETLDLSEFADGGCFRIGDTPISAATVLQNVSRGTGEEEGYYVYSLGDGSICVFEDHIFESGAVQCVCGGLAEAVVGNTPYSSFEEAVENRKGETVILMKDAILNNSCEVSTNLAIDWNGHKMQGFLWIKGGTTTLKDSQSGGGMHNGDNWCILLDGGSLVIEGGDYYGVWNDGGSMTVNGGTFHAYGEETPPLEGSIQVRTGYTFYDQDGKLVEWTNGFAVGSTVTLWPHTGHTLGENGKCTVCGSLGIEEGLCVRMTEDIKGALGNTFQVNGENVPFAINQADGAYYLSRTDGGSLENAIIQTYTDSKQTNSNGESYPTGMTVYRVVENKDHVLELRQETALTNLLIYRGASVRCTEPSGIRIITGMTKENKEALKGSGLDGFTLVQAGTVAAWTDEMGYDSCVTLEKSFKRYGAAYVKGVRDNVFKDLDNEIQYTNVLINFPDSKLGNSLVLRSYAILEKDEVQYTVYGGQVTRSIRGIANQIVGDTNIYGSLTAEEQAYVSKLAGQTQ